MESPGAYLKRERELRGITLKSVHEAVRVPLKFLEALESDEYETLPHPTFVKGFIKTYCKHLGLDEVDAVLRFEIFMKDRAEKAERPEKGKKPEFKRLVSSAEKSPSGFRAVIPFVAAGVVIIIFLFYIGYSRREASRPAPDAPETETLAQGPSGTQEAKEADEAAGAKTATELSKAPPDEHPTTTVFLTPPAAPPAAQAGRPAEASRASKEWVKPLYETAKSEASKAPEDKRHTLTARASETVWIKIRTDDKEPYDVMIKGGESVSWKASSVFSLIVGNAGGVSLVYDGRALPPLGKSGEVVSFKIPEEKTVGPPEQTSAQQPAPGPLDMPSEKPVEGPAVKQADKPTDKPADSPVNKPAESPQP